VRKMQKASSEKMPATSLLGAYRNVNIGDIFQPKLREVGGVIILDWSYGWKDLRSVLRRMNIDFETTRYQAEFIIPSDPLEAGYYQLLGIKALPAIPRKRESGYSGTMNLGPSEIKETTLLELVDQFATSQRKALGVDLEKAEIRPNGGKHRIAYHITRRNGALLIASSWIDMPEA
jgi:hypothetical protein